MRTLILIFAVITIAVNTLQAQVNYYSDPPNQVTISTEDGLVTYKYEILKLYNSNNKFFNTKRRFVDGSTDRLPQGQDFVLPDDYACNVNAIIYNALTEEQRTLYRNLILGINFHCDSQTGKVIDVEFMLLQRPYRYLPPEWYYQVEKKLKEKVYIIPTDIGKRTNYIYVGWGYSPKPPEEFDKNEFN